MLWVPTVLNLHFWLLTAPMAGWDICNMMCPGLAGGSGRQPAIAAGASRRLRVASERVVIAGALVSPRQRLSAPTLRSRRQSKMSQGQKGPAAWQ